MKVRKEIELYSDPSNKEALEWLFDRYHWESQWSFVACCKFVKYGDFSYQYRRIWSPTKEGLAIYMQLK